MKGTHRVIVQNKRIRYDFEIKRNITVIRGDSATGKTAVVKYPDDKVLVVADGAAFGSEMEKMMRLIKGYPMVTLYLPESFEWAQLIQHTQNSYLKYTKKQLNPVYLQEKVSDKILAVMEGIELD